MRLAALWFLSTLWLLPAVIEAAASARLCYAVPGTLGAVWLYSVENWLHHTAVASFLIVLVAASFSVQLCVFLPWWTVAGSACSSAGLYHAAVRKDPAGTIQWGQSFRGWRTLRVTIFPFHDTTRTLKWNTSSYIFYLVISSDSIKWKGF